ncbi:hypothetical protein MHYP_G00168110 [Metynnis hypsauchen]
MARHSRRRRFQVDEGGSPQHFKETLIENSAAGGRQRSQPGFEAELHLASPRPDSSQLRPISGASDTRSRSSEI